MFNGVVHSYLVEKEIEMIEIDQQVLFLSQCCFLKQP